MSEITKYQFILNGLDVSPYVEWRNSEVLATFDNEANQANITIDKVTFVNENANYIQSVIAMGLSGGVGIFEAIPFKVQIYDELNNIVAFDGLIDMTQDLTIDEFKQNVSVKLRKRDEITSLEEKLSALSFGYLESIGKFGNADYTDIKYLVQKKFNIMESIMLGIMGYMLAKELAEGIKTFSADTANIAAHAAGGLTGPISAIAYSIAIAIIDAIYLTVITTALIKVASKIIDQLVPIKRNAKTLNYRTALAKVSSHLGYTFTSNITDLDSIYYLPSNYYQDLTDIEGIVSEFIGTQKGIPYISDYGYNCADFFNHCKLLFNGKFAIINNSIVFYNADDMFWNTQAQWVIPSRRDKIKRYNTDELIANNIYSFETDLSDEWSISQYKGTSYETITDALISNNIQNKCIKGLKEVRFGVSLAHRKDNISGIEQALSQIAKTIDLFCGTNFQNKITSSVGLLIVGNNNYMKPKSIKVKNGRLVDRSLWCAKYLYENYYKGTSFLATVNGLPYYAQKSIYNDVRVGFGLADFVTLINNSIITDENGKKGKCIEVTWNFYGKAAKLNYFIREPYTSNLKETYIEPDNIKI